MATSARAATCRSRTRRASRPHEAASSPRAAAPGGGGRRSLTSARVSDDYRLAIELDASGDGFSFAESMRELSLQRDARRRLGDRVAVSADGPRVFVYTDTE